MSKQVQLFKKVVIIFLVIAWCQSYRASAQTKPAITYSTPQAYPINSQITPLAPVNTGGAVGTYGAVTQPFTVYNSNGLAINPVSGDIYITSSSGNSTYIYNSSGSLIFTQSGSAYSYSTPAGIAVNAAGTSFVANRGAGTLVETTSGNSITTIAGFSEPTSVAIDASGNIYVVDRNSAGGNGAGKVYKIAAGTNTPVPYITGLSYPWGVAVDGTGNLYISEPGFSNSVNTIFKVASGSTTPTTFVSSGISSPRNMVIDGAGNIFEADAGSGRVNLISPAGTVTNLLTGLDSPVGIALDASGNLYITGYNFGEVYKSVASGYTISGTLPAGLFFDKYSGAITGTPTALQAATNYTVTATNGGGSSSFVVSIAIVPAAPIITVSGSPGCGSGSVTLTASGGSPTGGTYNWYNSASGSSVATGITYKPIVSGTYYLSYTSGGLTSPKASAAVTINPVVSSPFAGAMVAYPFSGNTNDITGNNNNGIATGSPVLTTDRYGMANTAYSFNGSSQYISSTYAIYNPNTFTISLWFNTTTAGGKLIGFGSSQTGISGSYDRHIYMSNSGQIYYGIYQNYAVLVINTTASYNDGNWHHVIVTQGAAGSSLYVDGALQASNSSMTTGQGMSGYWRIGYDNLNNWVNPPSNYYFTGKLDDIAIYNRVLSSSEIAASNDVNLIGSNGPVCVSDAVTLTAPPIAGATYSWTDGTTTVTGNPATFASASAGNYTLTVTTGSGSCYSTATITPGSGQTYTWTGAAGNTDPANAVNWSFTTTGSVGQSPLFNGTENFIIPSGLSFYPALTANESMFNLTIANGASLNLNGFTLATACNIFNSSGGQLLYGNNNSSGITWNGTVASQNYFGSTTAGTGQTGNMLINNPTPGTVNISSGDLDVYNTITIAAGNLAVASSPVALTLKSTAANTASVAALPAGSSISGNVSVERYLSGGAGHRGYRLISSPVYASTVNSVNVYSINYLQNNILLSGSSGGGFDKVGNPTIFLFREDKVPSNVSFTSGNFWGVSAINNTPAYNYYLNGGSTAYNLPVGGGYMMFFRGDRSAASIATETVSSYVPVAVAVKASGTLNQGQVVARNWYTPSSSYLAYSGSGTGTNTNYPVRGFNLVGNPYASSIDWNTYNTSSTTTGIYVSNISATVYELNELTYNYDTYQAGSHIATNNGSNIIASGQGFFVLANNTNPQVIFNESAKTGSQNTGTSLFMSVKNKMASLNNTPVFSHLRLQLAMDSINRDDIYIGFDPNAQTEYVFDEDAQYKQGNGRVSLASISSDNINLAINKEPWPHVKEMVIPLSVNAVTDGTYQLKLTEFTGIPPLYEFWLKDAYKKDSLDISHNTSYAFAILKSDTSSFGNHRFSLVIKENPALHIRLLSFTAIKATGGTTAQIAWTTENEYDYTSFTLQRSTDGGASFTALGDVYSNSSGKYSYTDGSPLKPQDLYRLKITDLDGTITYSNIVTVMYANTGTLANSGIFIYPNPATSMVNLTVVQPLTAGTTNGVSANTATTNAMFGIKVVSSNGLLIKSSTSSSQSWKMDVSALIPGTYVIQVINNNTNSLVGQGAFVKL